MTVISLPWNLHLALMAGNQHQQVTSVVKDSWYVKHCVCICKLHKLNWQLYSHYIYTLSSIQFRACIRYEIWLRHHIIL